MVTLTLFSFLKKKKNLFQAPVLVKRDVLLLFSTSSSELEELQSCSLYHMCSCVSFSPSLLHAAWGLASLWSAPMGSAQVTPGTPLCLLTTGDHHSPGQEGGNGPGPMLRGFSRPGASELKSWQFLHHILPPTYLLPIHCFIHPTTFLFSPPTYSYSPLSTHSLLLPTVYQALF